MSLDTNEKESEMEETKKSNTEDLTFLEDVVYAIGTLFGLLLSFFED